MQVIDTFRSVVRLKMPTLTPVQRRLEQCVSVDDMRRIARRRQPRGVFDYIDGAAEDERSLARNVNAFSNYQFEPRVLRDVSNLDTSTSLFGRSMSMPLVIAPTNSFRYAPYVRMLESVNTARFVDLYRRHYALFDQAYRELGFPDGHFNDRAVEAIDVLLASPSLAEPPRLVQPKVFMQFADRDLEQLPAGQKLMLRVGAENAQRIKVKLAEIRAAITDPDLVVRR